MSEITYFRQFIDSGERGTRYFARICFKGGSYGVAFDCYSIPDAIRGAHDHLRNHAHGIKPTIEIIESLPDGTDCIVLEAFKPDFERY